MAKKTPNKPVRATRSRGTNQASLAKETLEYYEARVARDEDHFWQIVRSGSIMVSIFAGAPVLLLIRSDAKSSLPIIVTALALAAAYGATLFFSRALASFRSRLHQMYDLRDTAEDEFLKHRPQGELLQSKRPPIGSGVMKAFVGASTFIRFAFGLSVIICLLTVGFERVEEKLIWQANVEMVVLLLAALVVFGLFEGREWHNDAKRSNSRS